MKYNTLKNNIINILYFAVLWIPLTIYKVDFANKIDDLNYFAETLMAPKGGYNNINYIVGFTDTAYFLIMLFGQIGKTDTKLLIRYKKDGYIKKEIKECTIYTALFAFELVAVNEIYCLIFSDITMLINSKFFLCNLLYFIQLFLYYLVTALSLLFLRGVFNYSSLSLLITAGVYCILAVFNQMIDFALTPVYYCGFIGEWFSEGTFDLYEYTVNAVKCVIVIVVLSFLARFVFIKKDVLSDEK